MKSPPLLLAILLSGCAPSAPGPSTEAPDNTPPSQDSAPAAASKAGWSELEALDTLVVQAEKAATATDGLQGTLSGIIDQMSQAAAALNPARAPDPFTFQFYLEELQGHLAAVQQSGIDDATIQEHLHASHSAVARMLKAAGLSHSHAGHAH